MKKTGFLIVLLMIALATSIQAQYYPANPNNQRLQTDVTGTAVTRSFIAHFTVSAANAVAASNMGVLALTTLTASTQTATSSLTDPAVPRNIKIIGNVSGVIDTATIYGKDYAGTAISENIVFNGATGVEGNKAFASIDSIALPAQTHTPTAQVESIKFTAGASAGDTITFTFTAANMTGSPVDVGITIAATDTTATQVASRIADSLNANATFSAFATAAASNDTLRATVKTITANDATMAFALSDAGTTGITVGSSLNTTAGVNYDKVSVGWGDKLGLPYKLAHNTVLNAYLNNVKEGSAPTVATSSTVLSSNTIDLNSALNGTKVDVYLIVD